MNTALVIVILYMAALLFVSWYSTRIINRQKAKGESINYLLAGQNLNWFLVCMMIAGRAIGGVSTVGVAENAYTHGFSAGWYDLAWAMGAFLSGVFIVGKMRKANFFTINEFIEKTCGKASGLITVIVQVIVNFSVFALQVIAGGSILTALLPGVFTLTTAIIISAVVFGVISLIGGMWAASLSNIVNVVVILVGLTVGLIAVIHNFGGVAAIQARLPVTQPATPWTHFTKGMGMGAIMAWCFTMFLQSFSGAAAIQTVVSSRDSKSVKIGYIVAACIMAPAGFVAAYIGMVAAGSFPGLASAKLALPAVIGTLNPWLAGFTLAGLWAADVSTASACIMGVTSMITKGIIVRYFRPELSEHKQVVISRIIIAIAIVLAAIAALKMGGIVSTLMKLLAMFAPMAIMIILVLFAPKATRKSTGPMVMIIGVIYAALEITFIPQLVLYKQPIYAVLILSVVVWLITLIFDKRPADYSVLYTGTAGKTEKAEA
ncbi:MAG: sodium:solute symporter family protein, partial [Eubacteriaceae bacterium]|nr:sodium:solute symporter family protein [Eubacteriaceae bacterium]